MTLSKVHSKVSVINEIFKSRSKTSSLEKSGGIRARFRALPGTGGHHDHEGIRIR